MNTNNKLYSACLKKNNNSLEQTKMYLKNDLDLECPICLEKINIQQKLSNTKYINYCNFFFTYFLNYRINTNKNKIVKLQCSHLYHENCINEWFIVDKTCPMCRC